MNVIVAADKNWGIGKNNQLLVSIPADMKMFREETSSYLPEYIIPPLSHDGVL